MNGPRLWWIFIVFITLSSRKSTYYVLEGKCNVDKNNTNQNYLLLPVVIGGTPLRVMLIPNIVPISLQTLWVGKIC